MSKAVLDASALLAVLNNEPGAERLSPALLADATISAVNLSEVHGKLLQAGLSAADAWNAAVTPVGNVVAFTETHARIAGSLRLQTQPLGLSLADRACLAAAIQLKAPVYTADRTFKKLRLAIPIHVIR